MNSIYSRISVRKFQDRPVEQEKIDVILRAGFQAPSAGDQQPWEFYVVKDKAILKELSSTEVSPYCGMTKDAPVAIVITYRKDCRMLDFAQIDCSICMENMWLMTDALGLGGVMLGIAPLQNRMDKVKEILHLPENEEAFTIFPLGYPAESRSQENRTDLSRVHYI